ncbi:MAG: formyltransferase family protein [Mediterraneibacter faecis]
MLRVAVMVSGGGTNLQAIMDAVEQWNDHEYRDCGAVISNNKNAYALTRAKEHGIQAQCISPKDYATKRSVQSSTS